MNKKWLVQAGAVALATVGAMQPAVAAEGLTVTGNAGMTTDYRYRGVSQTQNDLAFQGGFDLVHSNGFYAGVWNSNVGFGTDNGGSGLETDVYGGYTFPIGPVTADFGLLQYIYSGVKNPANGAGTSGLDTLEAYAKFGWMGFTLAGYYALSDDYFGLQAAAGPNAADLSGSTYLNLSYKYSFNDKLSLNAGIGMTKYDRAIPATTGPNTDSYTDYSIGLTYNLKGFDLGLSYVSADNDAERLFGKDAAEGDVLLSIKKSF